MNSVLAWADTALLLLILVAAIIILHHVNFLRLVLPAWLFHIDSLVKGEDPPGDAPVPDWPTPNV